MIFPVGLDPLNIAIVRGAQADVPILEDPPLSNRSPEIDAMCREFGVPLASYWCALWAAKIWKAAGAAIPPIDDAKGWHPAKAETWRQWAFATSSFSSEPMIGAAALYAPNGKGPADHIGACVSSITPILMDFEGNTSGAGFDRNGELATVKPIDRVRLLGYVIPRRAA
jgi:hypothetical protein